MGIHRLTVIGGYCCRSTGGSLPNRKSTPTTSDPIKPTVQVRDYDPTVFRNNMIAHAAIAKAFNIPIVLTTSAEHGPNGLLPKEISSLYPDAPLIRRNGEVDAWDNADFRAAVKATGKSQVILAGITTDVCSYLPRFVHTSWKISC